MATSGQEGRKSQWCEDQSERHGRTIVLTDSKAAVAICTRSSQVSLEGQGLVHQLLPLTEELHRQLMAPGEGESGFIQGGSS